jgi:multidrug transporter EmrE-like cation transporter
MSPILQILLASLATLASQLLLKKGVSEVAALGSLSIGWHFLGKALLSPYVILAIVLQMAGYSLWILIISQVKLGYAFAISGGFFYILLAGAGWLFFDEVLTTIQWIGVILITAGVICMNIKAV